MALACRHHSGEWQDESGHWHPEAYQASDPVVPPCSTPRSVTLRVRRQGESLLVRAPPPLELEAPEGTAHDRGTGDWLIPIPDASPIVLRVREAPCAETLIVTFAPPAHGDEQEIEVTAQ